VSDLVPKHDSLADRTDARRLIPGDRDIRPCADRRILCRGLLLKPRAVGVCGDPAAAARGTRLRTKTWCQRFGRRQWEPAGWTVHALPLSAQRLAPERTPTRFSSAVYLALPARCACWTDGRPARDRPGLAREVVEDPAMSIERDVVLQFRVPEVPHAFGALCIGRRRA
jgi:hypothetical protein